MILYTGNSVYRPLYFFIYILYIFNLDNLISHERSGQKVLFYHLALYPFVYKMYGLVVCEDGVKSAVCVFVVLCFDKLCDRNNGPMG